MKKEAPSPTPTTHFDRWEAIDYVLSMARPYQMEVECLDELFNNITSPSFDGDYRRAAAEALYEWDI